MNKFREGILGALMDVYDNASDDFIKTVNQCTEDKYQTIVDKVTWDDDCRSVQTIVSHVVYSGYGYADYFRNIFGIPSEKPDKILIPFLSVPSSLKEMITYTEKTLEKRWNLDEKFLAEHKIESRWGPVYDLEQLFEHAIVHILRHKRQIEKFYRILNIAK